MNIRNDRYYDPPEEPELPICEECGHNMVVIRVQYTLPTDYTCTNPFCPSKHHGIARDMAERLVEFEWEVKNLNIKVNVLEGMLADTVSNGDKDGQ